MASASPYQGNDYQALSTFRPYKLPINDIFKANAAIDEFWKIGARKVKKAYENVLDLKLLSTDNKQIRDQFVKDAQKDIVKISSMNLADPSVQRQGVNIFAPIMRDQDIVGEDFVVRKSEQELSTAEGFRNKDGGKYYNPLSVENIQFEQNLLRTDPAVGGLNKRDGWKAIANNQSVYTPYADVSKEYKTISDTVKASELKKAQLSGDQWYIEEITKKGVSKDRMLAAIQEMGSPQLKEQLRVEGRNTYYKKLSSNPANVDNYFRALAGSYYATKINELQNQKAEMDYENYMTPNRPEYTSKKDSYKRASEEISKTIIKLQTKDAPAYIQEFTGLGNAANLSSSLAKIEQLWQQSALDNLAGKLAYETSSYNIKANPAKIAQENLALGYKRVSQDYAQLAETKRHNIASEQIDLLNALNKGKKGTGTSTDGSGNELLGEGMPNQSVSYNTPSQENFNTYRDNAKAVIDYMDNKDEPLKESAITNILGDQAWMGIQQATGTAKKIGDDVLLPNEIDKAAQFIKAYADKWDVTISGEKSPIPRGLDIDAYRRIVSNMNVKQFKDMMGVMVKSDVDFTGDLIGKLSGDKGIDKAANFRAVYNQTLRDQLNLSENITSKVKDRLGEYAPLFDNGGKVNMTDANIEKAYRRGVQSNNLVAYYEPVYETIRSQNSGVPSGYKPISKEEYLKLNDTLKKIATPSLSEFKSIIQKRTDPAYYSIRTENNQSGNQYTYDDKNAEEKVATVNRFETLSPDVRGTDADPEKEKLWRFIKMHSKDIVSHEIKTPDVGQTLPSVRFTMRDFGKADDEDNKKMIDAVNSTWFRTTGVPSKYYATTNSTSNVRYPGAYLMYAPAKMPDGTESGVFIRNTSRSPATITPDIEVKNLYTFTAEGRKRYITVDDIKKQFESVYKQPLEVFAQTNIDEVNRFISAFVTNVEKENRKKTSK